MGWRGWSGTRPWRRVCLCEVGWRIFSCAVLEWEIGGAHLLWMGNEAGFPRGNHIGMDCADP
ncbi:hypothetical protein N658DRAFT_499688 [Parathielavia hyrcaniae]|uniref:Uncharacterized protein n=1 Tax=Parathielavia hyrcaniae TaxID=113614 RepID=A0AAN6PX64_9PEZI|nr:hypothetical protein N658DRAFT_499688 [Parathielavia hyrcaniae]